jgi:hypothetical protein
MAEFDQMLAPIALYPDSLLSQVLLHAGARRAFGGRIK